MNNVYLSIKEFCRQAAISRSYYYKLAKAGKGPTSVTIGRKRVVTETPYDWICRIAEGGDEFLAQGNIPALAKPHDSPTGKNNPPRPVPRPSPSAPSRKR